MPRAEQSAIMVRVLELRRESSNQEWREEGFMTKKLRQGSIGAGAGAVLGGQFSATRCKWRQVDDRQNSCDTLGLGEVLVNCWSVDDGDRSL